MRELAQAGELPGERQRHDQCKCGDHDGAGAAGHRATAVEQQARQQAAGKAAQPERSRRIGDPLGQTREQAAVGLAVVDRTQAMAVAGERVGRTHQGAMLRQRRRDLFRRHAAMLTQQAIAHRDDCARVRDPSPPRSTRSHSVSAPIERLLMLAEPTRRKTVVDHHDLGMDHGVCGLAVLLDRRIEQPHAIAAGCLHDAPEADAAVAHGAPLDEGIVAARRHHHDLQRRPLAQPARQRGGDQTARS